MKLFFRAALLLAGINLLASCRPYGSDVNPTGNPFGSFKPLKIQFIFQRYWYKSETGLCLAAALEMWERYEREPFGFGGSKVQMPLADLTYQQHLPEGFSYTGVYAKPSWYKTKFDIWDEIKGNVGLFGSDKGSFRSYAEYIKNNPNLLNNIKVAASCDNYFKIMKAIRDNIYNPNDRRYTLTDASPGILGGRGDDIQNPGGRIGHAVLINGMNWDPVNDVPFAISIVDPAGPLDKWYSFTYTTGAYHLQDPRREYTDVYHSSALRRWAEGYAENKSVIGLIINRVIPSVYAFVRIRDGVPSHKGISDNLANDGINLLPAELKEAALKNAIGGI